MYKSIKTIVLIVFLFVAFVGKGFGLPYSVSSFTYLNTIVQGAATYNDFEINLIGDINWTSALTMPNVNKGTIIGGNGTTIRTLTVTGTTRMLNLALKELSFKGNIDFVGITYNITGAMMYFSNSIINFTNSSVNVSRSRATSSSGGAIYVIAGSTINFSNSSVSFSGNTAGNYGGAIAATQMTINLTNSSVSFSENSANYGGTIFLDQWMIVNFLNSTVLFKLNTAGTYGGAIYATGRTATKTSMTFRNSQVSFSGNIAAGRTNDINMREAQLYMYPEAKDIRITGGINADANSLIIYEGSTQHPLYLGGYNPISASTVIVRGNKGAAGSGGLYLYLSATAISTLTVTNSSFSFTNNAAVGSVSGGALSIVSSSVSFAASKVYFINNTAGLYAGALAIEKSTVVFNQTTLVEFTSNTAYSSVGALWINSNAQVTFKGTTTFRFNKSSALNSHAGGGAIFLRDNDTLTFEGSVELTSNTALKNDEGGAIYVNPGINSLIFNADTVKFIGNTASVGDGGAIYAANPTDFQRGKIWFISNSGANGGAIYMTGNSASMKFSNSSVSFTSNVATTNGGAIYAQ
ncbi:MAG: hypothetical protein LBT79_05005, partial [Elusimicrobiota bacterium]|nr:hypothetical protein [Elusimicrobiota bacterium]